MTPILLLLLATLTAQAFEFTGRFSAFRLAAKANSRTSPRNVEVQSPVGQLINRQTQNWMRGDLYAKSFRVSLAVLRSCLHDPGKLHTHPALA